MTKSERVMHEALQKLRLAGSIFWDSSWGSPSAIANEALNAADVPLARADDDAWKAEPWPALVVEPGGVRLLGVGALPAGRYRINVDPPAVLPGQPVVLGVDLARRPDATAIALRTPAMDQCPGCGVADGQEHWDNCPTEGVR